MNDHEHNFWRTSSGALVCPCGVSRRPVVELTPTERAEVDRFGIFEVDQ